MDRAEEQAAVDEFLSKGWDVADLTTPISEENLHPALKRWYDPDSKFAPMVSHPLMVEIALGGPKAMNARYLHKRDAFAKAVRDQDYDRALAFIEKPYRLDVLWSWWSGGRIREDIVKQLLPSAWMACEFPYQSIDKAVPLFEAVGYCGDVPNLPPGLYDIYRGNNEDEKRPGWSWSLTLSLAQWFANRGTAKVVKPVLWMGRVDAEHILARFEGRGETEVVVDPANVQHLKRVDYPAHAAESPPGDLFKSVHGR